MQVLCVYNPRSGRGRAKQLVEQLLKAFSELGVVARSVQSRRLADGERYQELDEADAVVFVGGDGTLSSHLALCATYGLPISFLGAGNESLFRQAFSLPSEPRALAKVVVAGRQRTANFALANGHAFFHMCSLGLDADIVRTVAESRGAGVSNWIYARKALAAGLSYHMPRITLRVDEVEVLTEVAGALVIANHYTYAGDLRPVPEADYGSSRLHARFYPEQSLRKYAGWGFCYLKGGRIDVGQSQLFQGACFEVEGACNLQIDGEYLGDPPLRVVQAPGQLRVIC